MKLATSEEHQAAGLLQKQVKAQGKLRSSDGSLTVVLSAVVGKRTHWARVLSSLQIFSFLPPTTTDYLRLTLTPTTAWADTAPTLATGTEPTYRPMHPPNRNLQQIVLPHAHTHERQQRLHLELPSKG
ncbi:hypothetical protein AgCh_038645 [Apium graveolens]